MAAFRRQNGGSGSDFSTVLLQLLDFGGSPMGECQMFWLGKFPPNHCVSGFDASSSRTDAMTVPKLSNFCRGPSVSRNFSNQPFQSTLRNRFCFLHSLPQFGGLRSQGLKERSLGKITLFVFFYEPMPGPFGDAQAVAGDFRSRSSSARSIFRNVNQ